jgi:Leucine-rich repeat (LRR) protein
MKSKLLILCLLIAQIGISQNIFFPDSEFKNYLLIANIDYNVDPYGTPTTFPPIDANDDGEISQAEALNVISLDFSYLNITNLEGLQYFTNLKRIFSFCPNFPTFNQPTLVNLEELSLFNICGNGALTSINISANTNLKKFQCSNNVITSMNFSSNTQLEEITISGAQLTSVNFNNLSNLKFLSYYGKSATIDISDAVNLLSLFCYGNSATIVYPTSNLLTSIDLSNQTKLIYLDLSGNNISSLNLNNCLNLEDITISRNQISTLSIDNLEYVKNLKCEDNLLTSLNVDNMFNLQSLYCKNNQLLSLSTKNGIIEDYIDFSGNPNLASVCCDENEVVYLQNQCFLNGNDTTTVDSTCETAVAGRISMYPNPVTDMLHLDSTTTITKIEIFAMSGLMVMNNQLDSNVVNLSELQSGIYFIKVYIGDDVSTMKFSKM